MKADGRACGRHGHCGQYGQHQQRGQRSDKAHGKVLCTVAEVAPAAAEGVGYAVAERLGFFGDLLYLLYRYIYGRIRDQIVIGALLGGIALDLVLHFCELVLDGEQRFQITGLLHHRVQALLLQLQAFQAGLHIHISAGHILGGFLLAHQVAGAAGALQKDAVLLCRDAELIICGAVCTLVSGRIDAGGGDISAAGLGGPRQRRTGGVEVQRFDGERGVQDDLPPVLGQQIRAVLHGVGQVRGPGRFGGGSACIRGICLGRAVH